MSGLRLSLWGPTSSGKTMFLAQVYHNWSKEDPEWQIFPSPEAMPFINTMRQFIDIQNRFPPNTDVGKVQQIRWTFHHRASKSSVDLRVEDRAGKEFQDLGPAVMERLVEADALILLFDAQANDTRVLRQQIVGALEHIHLERRAAGGPLHDDRPVAICLTKADEYAHSAADVARMIEEPFEFVQGWLRDRGEVDVVDRIAQYCSRCRFFPVSAVGVIERPGGRLVPSVVYDEKFEGRIVGQAQPINLSTPFTWIFSELLPEPG